MDQKPWYQKRKVDSSFPFILQDNHFRAFAFHWHELLEFAYILKGRIFISVEGKTYEALQDDIVIINSGTIHGFFDANPGTIVSIYQIGLELFDHALIDLRDRIFQKLVFSRKTFVSPDKDGEIYNRLKEILLSIRQEYYNQKEGFRLAIKSKLYELALLFLRNIPAKQPLPKETARRNFNHQILERVFSFIHSNAGNPDVSLEQGAEAAALSKFYFTRFFKEHTGQTFHTYLSKVRVNYAKEYLAESDMPITDIAYHCGFASLKTFNRLFKTYTGTSPSAYRSGKKSATVLS